jgi:hypothetical protein
MLVITRWRPIQNIQGLTLDAIIEKASALIKHYAAGASSPGGQGFAAFYYNEVGPEFVVLQTVEDFTALDRIEADKSNNEFGLHLIRLGFGISSIEYLRDIDRLGKVRDMFRSLK